ncbi:hypothetical protein J6590_031243 [Homalodisca vitripennis]|nr:hypothetical protein J6590_031243 [Homalodisca vitripennis]
MSQYRVEDSAGRCRGALQTQSLTLDRNQASPLLINSRPKRHNTGVTWCQALAPQRLVLGTPVPHGTVIIVLGLLLATLCSRTAATVVCEDYQCRTPQRLVLGTPVPHGTVIIVLGLLLATLCSRTAATVVCEDYQCRTPQRLVLGTPVPHGTVIIVLGLLLATLCSRTAATVVCEDYQCRSLKGD